MVWTGVGRGGGDGLGLEQGYTGLEHMRSNTLCYGGSFSGNQEARARTLWGRALMASVGFGESLRMGAALAHLGSQPVFFQ